MKMAVAAAPPLVAQILKVLQKVWVLRSGGNLECSALIPQPRGWLVGGRPVGQMKLIFSSASGTRGDPEPHPATAIATPLPTPRPVTLLSEPRPRTVTLLPMPRPVTPPPPNPASQRPLLLFICLHSLQSPASGGQRSW